MALIRLETITNRLRGVINLVTDSGRLLQNLIVVGFIIVFVAADRSRTEFLGILILQEALDGYRKLLAWRSLIIV